MNMIPGYAGEIARDVPLAPYTTWRIGGPAEYFLEPINTAELLHICAFAAERGIPLQVLGNGSNVLIDDAGLAGFVVRLRCTAADCRIDADAGTLQATAGVMLPALAARAAHAGWTGLEFICAIPGTLGGAIAGNAGVGGLHGPAMQSVLNIVEIWDPLLRRVRQLTVPELTYGYRRSNVREHDWVILSAQLRLTGREEPAAIIARHREICARRRGKFPPERATAGSVFRLAAEREGEERTPGWLIEHAGLKGTRVGGAFVSPVHANWIVNDGSATAADVRQLMTRISETVRREYGVPLVPEVCLLTGHTVWVQAVA